MAKQESIIKFDGALREVSMIKAKSDTDIIRSSKQGKGESVRETAQESVRDTARSAEATTIPIFPQPSARTHPSFNF